MPGRDADVGRRGRQEAWLVSGLSETESNEINGQKAHNPGSLFRQNKYAVDLSGLCLLHH